MEPGMVTMEAEGSTRDRLVRAATMEFGERGFSGTDTNKIARRAGFAPQTFYRWFADKTEIFIAAYRLWEEEERTQMGALMRRKAEEADLVDAAVAHHRAYLAFRRSLRSLSLENPAVRAARAESRLRQIERIQSWSPRSTADVAVMLLQLERLSDALAEGEFLDMGLDEAAGRAGLAQLLRDLRSPA
jgi:AcrR family transcriptional regulator